MDKDVTNATLGGAVGGLFQAAMMKYGDPFLAPMYLYSYTQYAADLRKAGYIPSISTQTDADIGTLINSTAGYEWAAGSPANLVGLNKRTANRDTYAAAVGQKSSSVMLPSTLGSTLVGTLAIVDAEKHYLGKKKDEIMEASLGGALIASGLGRMFFGGVRVYPSGFDSVSTPTVAYMDKSAVQNLQRLSSENQRLQNELTQIRNAQPPRGMPPGIPSYSVTANQPVVQVTEIIPSKGAEAIKERTGLMGGRMNKATPETIRRRTGLVTLAGGK